MVKLFTRDRDRWAKDKTDILVGVDAYMAIHTLGYMGLV